MSKLPGHTSAHSRNFQVSPCGPQSASVGEFGHRTEKPAVRGQTASSWTNRAIHKPESSMPFSYSGRVCHCLGDCASRTPSWQYHVSHSCSHMPWSYKGGPRLWGRGFIFFLKSPPCKRSQLSTSSSLWSPTTPLAAGMNPSITAQINPGSSHTN